MLRYLGYRIKRPGMYLHTSLAISIGESWTLYKVFLSPACTDIYFDLSLISRIEEKSSGAWMDGLTTKFKKSKTGDVRLPIGMQ